MSALDAFTVKTHAELARLVTEAKTARRAIDHRPCPDAGACRHCRQIWAAHIRIDDHLSQLDEAAVNQDTRSKPADPPPPSTHCGICGRTRYRGFQGAVCCLACDGTPFGSEWQSLDLEAQE